MALALREQRSLPRGWGQQASGSESAMRWDVQESGDESVGDVLRDAGATKRKTMVVDKKDLDVQCGTQRDEQLCKYASYGLDDHRIQRLLTEGHANLVFVVFAVVDDVCVV